MTELSQDYYQILGLSRTASAEEIKRAYKARSKELHPDKMPKANEAVVAKATRILLLVKQAYRVLSDVGKRLQYDYEHPAEQEIKPFEETEFSASKGASFEPLFPKKSEGFSAMAPKAKEGFEPLDMHLRRGRN